MAPPQRGGRNKGKPDLRPDRKQFKKHRKEADDGEQQPQPASAALLAAAADDADFPRGEPRAALSFKRANFPR